MDDETDALELARKWANAARRNPPESGEFLAQDLDTIAEEIVRLRRLRDGMVELLRAVNPYSGAVRS